MNRLVTEGIVLHRTNFGEADRIVTMITPDQGKLRLMTKGVRKPKSKLAGGIELFSINSITFLPGKKDIGTLISSRLKTHFGRIAEDINRTMLGYEMLKRLDRATEDAAEAEYFDLLAATLMALDNHTSLELIELWFDAQLLKLAGHQPNLKTRLDSQPLTIGQRYNFDFERMGLIAAEQGRLTANHIKFLRLIFKLDSPEQLAKIQDAEKVVSTCAQVVGTMRRQYIHQ